MSISSVATGITYEVSRSLYPPVYTMFLERYYSPFPFIGLRENQKIFLGINPFWDKYPIEVTEHKAGYDDYVRQGRERIVGVYGSLWCSLPNSGLWVRGSFSADLHGLHTFCPHALKGRSDLLVALGYSGGFSQNLQCQLYILGGTPLEDKLQTRCFINVVQPRSASVGLGSDIYVGHAFFYESLHAGFITTGRVLRFIDLHSTAIDFIVGFTGVWGMHTFEAGYNPTFVIHDTAKFSDSHFLDFHKDSLYGFYYYTFYLGGIPFSLGFGASWSLGNSSTTFRIVA